MRGPFSRPALLVMVACVALAPATVRADEPAPPGVPPAAGSATLNFVAPKGWSDVTRPTGRPGYWKDWTISDGGVVHSIVMSVTTETRRALPYGDAAVAAFKALPNVKVLDYGPTTTCGDVPAFGYTYRSDRTPGHPLIIRHVLVDIGPALGDVSYAHPPEIADRADALDAMSTLCEQQTYAPRAPAAWRAGRITSVGPQAIDVFTAPAGGASLIALAVPAAFSAPRTLPVAQLGPGATVVADGEETCGTTPVRRTRYRTGSGANVKVTETVSGYRHGMRYVYTYTRPESTPLDSEAELALTSFCDAGATLATPPPAPRPPV